MTAFANPPLFRPLWTATPRQAAQIVDPVAFFLALAFAPLAVTALTFYLFIPVFALVFGAPTYLTFGALFYWLALRRGVDGVFQMTGIGFLANLASAPAVLIVFSSFSPRDAVGMTLMIIGFGCIFAPLWSAAFALTYRWLRRDLFQS